MPYVMVGTENGASMAPAINSYILAQHLPDAPVDYLPRLRARLPVPVPQPVRGPRRPLPRHRRHRRLNLPASASNHTARPLRQRAENEPNMNDLLDFVLDAHGGLNRWSDVARPPPSWPPGGPFWGLEGFPTRSWTRP